MEEPRPTKKMVKTKRVAKQEGLTREGRADDEAAGFATRGTLTTFGGTASSSTSESSMTAGVDLTRFFFAAMDRIGVGESWTFSEQPCLAKIQDSQRFASFLKTRLESTAQTRFNFEQRSH